VYSHIWILEAGVSIVISHSFTHNLQSFIKPDVVYMERIRGSRSNPGPVDYYSTAFTRRHASSSQYKVVLYLTYVTWQREVRWISWESKYFLINIQIIFIVLQNNSLYRHYTSDNVRSNNDSLRKLWQQKLKAISKDDFS